MPKSCPQNGCSMRAQPLPVTSPPCPLQGPAWGLASSRSTTYFALLKIHCLPGKASPFISGPLRPLRRSHQNKHRPRAWPLRMTAENKVGFVMATLGSGQGCRRGTDLTLGARLGGGAPGPLTPGSAQAGPRDSQSPFQACEQYSCPRQTKSAKAEQATYLGRSGHPASGDGHWRSV